MSRRRGRPARLDSAEGSTGKARSPEVLHRPLPGPLGGGDAVVPVGFPVRGGVELVEGFDDELVGTQDADPLAVAWVELDPAANAAGGPRLSRAGSRITAWVIPTNEELMIARHTRTLVATGAPR